MLKNKMQLTTSEMSIAFDLLSKGYNWLARDDNGFLYAYKDKPESNEGRLLWATDDKSWTPVDGELFKAITCQEGQVDIRVLVGEPELSLSAVNDWIKKQRAEGRGIELNEYGSLSMTRSYEIDATLLEDCLESYGIKEIPETLYDILCSVYAAGCDTQRKAIGGLIENAITEYNISGDVVVNTLSEIYSKRGGVYGPIVSTFVDAVYNKGVEDGYMDQ